jgi:crossover junction endodeoxyribonuclease RuvC
MEPIKPVKQGRGAYNRCMASTSTSTSAATVRILGIDPGLNISGFGVIEKTGSKLAYIASGCVRAPRGELPDRLKTIFEGLHQVIAEYAPAQVAIERVFVNVNPVATLALGQARGAAICAAVHAGLNVAEYTALQVKQAVVGKGKAGKEQVQAMVVRLLALPGAPGADAADALACAICHAHGGQGMGQLATRGLRMKRGRLVGRAAMLKVKVPA